MPTSLAIIGIGAVADLHARAIRDLDGAELIAGSCRTASTGRAFAADFDCEWYADYHALLETESPDVVVVTTPSGAHLEPAVAAAEHGAHVLCEKPLEITLERVDRMIDAADAAEVKLGGVFQQRFNPVLRVVRDAVTEGRFGHLSVARAEVPWWRDDVYYAGTWKGTRELDGGGAMMNQSIHAVDAIQWLAAGAMDLEPTVHPIEAVTAYTATRAHDSADVEVEDTAVAILRYRDGTLGQLLGATSMYPGHLRRLQIAGRDGTAEIREDQLATWAFRDDRPSDAAVRERFADQSAGTGAADPMAIDYANHRRNIAAFLDWVAEDGDYALTGREARKAVAVVRAIYKSANTGGPVTIE